MTLGELAGRIGAVLEPAVPGGDPADSLPIDGVAGIGEAGPSEVAFVANPKYAAAVRRTRAAAVIVDRAFPAIPLPTLRVADPKYAFTLAVATFHPQQTFAPGVHPTAAIASSARLGARAHIGPFVVVDENCRIGDDAVLLAHVVLYPGVQIGHRFMAHSHAVVRENCRLGDDVVLGNGAVIGSDGFGFARNPQGRWVKTLHPGPVILEDAVEVQAHSCIDRAIVGETRIGKGTKIDNLVQVGHASTVGENSLLCAQVGLAGSTHVGNNVTLAGQVGVAGHLTIGDGAVATAQTGIPSDVPPGAVVSGYPAMDNRAWLRMVASLQRVPDLLRRLRTEDKK
ncbi:MAG TPA: UDP-3-O-(3-hydroxymyristoyl)glucosamine N-acyltransferase [Acidobacteriaceae bacterium]|nr:UDP-3-O-(3-hydroxymyristoyl)glucosamine N-acyltransferase [Acidobacteriaceae bacterium]